MTKAIPKANGRNFTAVKIPTETMAVDQKIGRILRWLNMAIDQDSITFLILFWNRRRYFLCLQTLFLQPDFLQPSWLLFQLS
jgi:hypothetical protein